MDIVVTWPKSRPLASYVMECNRAKSNDLLVNFRVPLLPSFGVAAFDYGAPEVRCYRVHDGHVRGWLKIVAAEERGHGEVARVRADPLAAVSAYWPAGEYIVCDPEWHDLGFRGHATVMPGFRGWRWFDRARLG